MTYSILGYSTGRIIEKASTRVFFKEPYHPYSLGLKNAFPSILEIGEELISIPGAPPNLMAEQKGCGFQERCPFRTDKCQKILPELQEVGKVGEDHLIACHYPERVEEFRENSKKRETWEMVRERIIGEDEGEILGLAGESGSGKTTMGEILVRLQEITEGEVIFDGHEIVSNSREEEKKFRKEVQMIFQDPYETLNPRFTILETIAEPLKIFGMKSQDEIYDRVIEVLEIAELRPAEQYIFRYPHELSGGQRQRVAIARGIVLEPKFLVADEPVSMLDVSVRADILNLLKSLRKKMGLTMLYISHDLSTIKYLCDRIAIMYLGKIVEIGHVNEVIHNPKHPYTKVLLSCGLVDKSNRKRNSYTCDCGNNLHSDLNAARNICDIGREIIAKTSA